jgi:hypothetical protein
VQAVYDKATDPGSPFHRVEELLAATQRRLSSGDLMHATHDEVEQYVKAQGRLMMNALLRDHFALRGQAEALALVVGADGKERTHVRCGAERTLVTTVGAVPVPRMAYNGCGLSALHPTDAELNLPEDSYSFEVRRQIAMLAAEVSFERAGQQFQELTGVHVALRQIEELTRAASQDMEPFYAEGRADLAVEATSDLLVLTADQKGIVMRHEHLRPETREKAATSRPKLESRHTRGEKPNRKRMATVAAVYTVAPHLRSAEDVVAGLRHLKPVPDARKPRPPRPEFKRVWASVEADLPDVIGQLFDEAERRDPLRSKRWLMVVDGDRKLEKAARREAKQRGVKLTLVLDFIHALEYLWCAGHALFTEGTPELEAWVLDRLTALLHGKVSSVAAGMRRSATLRGLSSSARAPIDRAANYFLKRKSMMRYDELLVLGAPIASGVIEGTCRSLVNDRLDITGARWSVRGAEAVLRLRAILRSGDWQEYWRFHIFAEHDRNHASRYAGNTPPDVEIPRKHGHLRRVK